MCSHRATRVNVLRLIWALRDEKEISKVLLGAKVNDKLAPTLYFSTGIYIISILPKIPTWHRLGFECRPLPVNRALQTAVKYLLKHILGSVEVNARHMYGLGINIRVVDGNLERFRLKTLIQLEEATSYWVIWAPDLFVSIIAFDFNLNIFHSWAIGRTHHAVMEEKEDRFDFRVVLKLVLELHIGSRTSNLFWKVRLIRIVEGWAHIMGAI